MGYEKFDRKRFGSYGGRGSEFISVTKWGFGISRRSHRSFFEKCEYVELYYDPEKKTIGIKPLLKKTTDAFKITRHNGSCWIRAKHFIVHYKIYHEKRKRCIPQWNEEYKMVEIEL